MDGAKARRAVGHCWIGILHVVECVEKLTPEVQGPFLRAAKFEDAREGKIRIVLLRTTHHTSAAVAVVCSAIKGGSGTKRGGVEVTREPAAKAAAGFDLTVEDAGAELRARRADGTVDGATERVGDGEPVPALDGSHARNSPAIDGLPQHEVAIVKQRQLPAAPSNP